MPSQPDRFDTFYGVDGCRAGWFFVAIGPDDKIRFGVMKRISDLADIRKKRTLFLVDIPIGLPSSRQPVRSCDVEARRLLRPLRHSSVFSPPCREALSAGSYTEACRINRKIVGRMMSRQAYFIGGKIREVDDLLRRKPGLRRVVREIHPEICFQSMAGGVPMPHNKRSAAGFAERLALLQTHRSDAGALVNSALVRFRRKDVGRDDILDALAAAVTGHAAKGRLHSLPETPEFDEAGLPMEIVWRMPAWPNLFCFHEKRASND